MKLKVQIFSVVLLCLVVEIYGCWKKASPTLANTTTTSTTTTTTTTASPIKSEKVKDSESARQRPSGGNQLQHWSGVETWELRDLAEELLRLDTNSVGSQLKLNLQGHTSFASQDDVAPQPLFSNVRSRDTILQGNTLTPFKNLLDNYVYDVRNAEDLTPLKRKEINAFLDAIMNTNVMKRTEVFLQRKGLVKGSLREQLDLIWFTPYSRSGGVIGSSGFEHVFLGEVKKGKVSGLHNWVFFQKEEEEKDLNYKGYMKVIDLGTKGEILKAQFDWMNYPKDAGSLFIGTAPELEMALYTVCFYARPNAGCNLQMNGNRFRIKVYTQPVGNKKLIGSAFPELF